MTILKNIVTVLIIIFMHFATINAVETTPLDATTDFMKDLKSGKTAEVAKYIDNEYVNFLQNGVEGDLSKEMREALFANFSYEVREIDVKDRQARVTILIRNSNFTKVLKNYEKVSYKYVMKNFDSKKVTDKEKLGAKCVEIYIKQIAKATKSDKINESEVEVELIADGNYGWNVQVTDELMRAILGGLKLP